RTVSKVVARVHGLSVTAIANHRNVLTSRCSSSHVNCRLAVIVGVGGLIRRTTNRGRAAGRSNRYGKAASFSRSGGSGHDRRSLWEETIVAVIDRNRATVRTPTGRREVDDRAGGAVRVVGIFVGVSRGSYVVRTYQRTRATAAAGPNRIRSSSGAVVIAVYLLSVA